MGKLDGIKKNPVGTALDAHDVGNLAADVSAAGIAAAQQNKIETAKSLSSSLLGILGILSPMPGAGMATDVTAEAPHICFYEKTNGKWSPQSWFPISVDQYER